MADVTVRLNRRKIEELGSSSAVGHVLLRPRAERIMARARPKAPKMIEGAIWYVKAGKAKRGRRGAFAQVVVEHERAILAEYGGRYTRPSAMLRSSL